MLQPSLLARSALAGVAALMTFGAGAVLPSTAAAQPSGTYGADESYRDCQDQKTGGTVAGAVIGGVLGAVIGGNVAGRGDRGGGAVIGGALGATAGGAVGNSSVDCGDAYPPQPGYEGPGYGPGYSDGYAPPPPPPYGDQGYGYDRSAPPPPDGYGNGYDDPGPPPPDAGDYYDNRGYSDQPPPESYDPRS